MCVYVLRAVRESYHNYTKRHHVTNEKVKKKKKKRYAMHAHKRHSPCASAHDATLPPPARLLVPRAPLPIPIPPRRPRRHTLPHQHARPRRRLKHVVHALDLERRTLLVRTRTDLARHTLRLRPRHIAPTVRRVRGRPQVGFTPDKQNRDRRPAYVPDFFDPLARGSVRGGEMGGARRAP
jgi:hypothetical protein